MAVLTKLLYFLPHIGSSILALKSLNCLLSIKKGYFRKSLLVIGCFILVGMIIFIGDVDNLPGTFIFFLISVLICCEGTILQRITIGLMFASTAFACNALIDNLVIISFDYGSFFRFLFWILFYLFLHHYAPEKNYELSSSLWKLLLFLTAIPFGIVLSIILLAGNDLVPGSRPMIIFYILLALALLSFIGLLQTIIVLIKQQYLERQSRLMDTNRKHYETLEQQQFEVRRLKHDMANHLQTLKFLPETDKSKYINNLLDTAAFTKTVQYCADPTINAVINSKMGQIEDLGINFHVKADIPSILPFDKVDICTIFANSLDNAIEYCSKLPSSRREIQLDTQIRKGLFVLKTTNPFLGSDMEVSAKVLPETSKQNTEEHGFGLKSIREAVRHNNGHLEVQVKDGQFILFIYLLEH